MHNQNMKIDMLAPIPFRPRRSPRWSSIEVVEDGVWGLVRKREFPLSAAAESPAFGPFLGAWKEAALRGKTLTLDRLTPLWTEPRDVGLHLIEVRDGMPDAWIFVRFDVRVTSHGRDFTGRSFGDYPIPFIRAAASNDLYTAATLRRPSLIEVMCPIGRYLRLMLPVHQPAGDRLFLLSVVQILAVGGPRRIEPMLAEAGPPRPGLMSDLDLLAWVVGVTVPESMARNLAAALLSRFGDLGDVLRASPEALAQVQGASAGLHPLFQASVELARRAIRTEVGVRAFANRFTFIDYVTVCFAHSRVEELCPPLHRDELCGNRPRPQSSERRSAALGRRCRDDGGDGAVARPYRRRAGRSSDRLPWGRVEHAGARPRAIRIAARSLPLVRRQPARPGTGRAGVAERVFSRAWKAGPGRMSRSVSSRTASPSIWAMSSVPARQARWTSSVGRPGRQ